VRSAWSLWSMPELRPLDHSSALWRTLAHSSRQTTLTYATKGNVTVNLHVESRPDQ